jgi:hypothetical protein
MVLKKVIPSALAKNQSSVFQPVAPNITNNYRGYIIFTSIFYLNFLDITHNAQLRAGRKLNNKTHNEALTEHTVL